MLTNPGNQAEQSNKEKGAHTLIDFSGADQDNPDKK